jgi:hypothetical protein
VKVTTLRMEFCSRMLRGRGTRVSQGPSCLCNLFNSESTDIYQRARKFRGLKCRAGLHTVQLGLRTNRAFRRGCNKVVASSRRLRAGLVALEAPSRCLI